MKVSTRHRTPDDPFGRFGGGWQWALGVKASRLRRPSGTVLIQLLVFTVRIDWGPR